MIEIFNIDNAIIWDETVCSINNHDIYYLSGYAKPFQIHGDGEPLLLVYSNSRIKGICVMMKRDIAAIPFFNGLIEPHDYYDIITPYGYGGFIFDRNPTIEEMEDLKRELILIFHEMKIVSAFFRFHPIIGNAKDSQLILDVSDLGKTIAIDLSSSEIIWNNITSKNRGHIRKAKKNGVEIRHGKGGSLLNIFKEIYDETMRKDNAIDYYYFKRDFYDSIDHELKNNYEIFYAIYQDKIIAMSIMLFCNGQMHYHLSGSRQEYRHLNPTNLLLYEAALWGNENGFKTLHLGGGVGSGEDSLYKFKEAFNKNSGLQFSIGKMIIIPEIYNKLVELREKKDPNFETKSSFFPLYRS